MRNFKFYFFLFLFVTLLGVIMFFEAKSFSIGNIIASAFLGISLEELWHAIQDFTDSTNWKKSQRKLKRGTFIKDSTLIRISFAYLYRIKVENKYFLIKNERGTNKFQPVGGVYKFKENEKIQLKNLFQIKDDDKIPIDESSRDDYRLRMENKYLRRFVKRFDNKAERENLENLSREFKEEMIDTGIINWNCISYRFCGRHMTDVKYSDHFQTYELLLADVVELIPTKEQEDDLKNLMKQTSNKFCFATAEEISSFGVNTITGNLKDYIAEHSKKIIQENEGQLIKTPNFGKTYNVALSKK